MVDNTCTSDINTGLSSEVEERNDLDHRLSVEGQLMHDVSSILGAENEDSLNEIYFLFQNNWIKLKVSEQELNKLRNDLEEMIIKLLQSRAHDVSKQEAQEQNENEDLEKKTENREVQESTHRRDVNQECDNSARDNKDRIEHETIDTGKDRQDHGPEERHEKLKSEDRIEFEDVI